MIKLTTKEGNLYLRPSDITRISSLDPDEIESSPLAITRVHMGGTVYFVTQSADEVNALIIMHLSTLEKTAKTKKTKKVWYR